MQLVLPTVGRRAEVWVGDGAFVKAPLGRDRMEVISIEHLLLFSCQRLYDCSPSHSHLEWKLQEGEIWIFFFSFLPRNPSLGNNAGHIVDPLQQPVEWMDIPKTLQSLYDPLL